MVRNLIVASILLFTACVNAQVPQGMQDLLNLKFISFVSVFKAENGHKTYVPCEGFIFKNKYVATCYHVLVNKNAKLVSITIFYNNEDDSTKGAAWKDSMKIKPVLLNPHKYDSLDESTDFAILKLPKKIYGKDIEISDRNLDVFETVYAKGQLRVTINGIVRFSQLIAPLNFIASKPENGCNALLFVGQADHGFSGSVIFNSRGEGIGMILKGWDQFPEDILGAALTQGQINMLQYDTLKLCYKNGEKVGFAIPLSYFLKKYAGSLTN